MKREIRSITGLRGIAACAVMVGHFTEDSVRSGVVGRLLDHTYYAVDLFFVLSGFVLAMVYGRTMRAPNIGGAFALFLQHRLARIYPLYAVTTLICFAMVRAGLPVYGDPNGSALALASNLLMTQSWGWPSDSLNGPGWSISTEWAANLLFPAIALVVLNRRWFASSLAIGLALAVWILSAHFATAWYWGTPIILQWRALRVPQPLIGCTIEFAFGMFCWRLRDRAGWTGALGRTDLSCILVAGAAATYIMRDAQFAFVLTMGMLVIALSLETSPFANLLGSPIVNRLGVISFSIYLVHAPARSAVPGLSRLLGSAGIHHARSAAAVSVMMLVLGVADVTYRFVETPLRRLIRLTFAARLGSAPGGGEPASAPAIRS